MACAGCLHSDARRPRLHLWMHVASKASCSKRSNRLRRCASANKHYASTRCVQQPHTTRLLRLLARRASRRAAQTRVEVRVEVSVVEVRVVEFRVEVRMEVRVVPLPGARAARICAVQRSANVCTFSGAHFSAALPRGARSRASPRGRAALNGELRASKKDCYSKLYIFSWPPPSVGRPCRTTTERQGFVDGALGPANDARDGSAAQTPAGVAARDGQEVSFHKSVIS
eukprot:scaffold26988_cov54-Phaeocystis_antarctica.AAC.1